MVPACRVSQHLKSCEIGFHSRQRFCFFMATSGNLIPSTLKPYGSTRSNRLQRNTAPNSVSRVHVSCFQAKSPGETPVLADCFSQQEKDRELHSDGLPSVTGSIVALGKFDALHIGHRELAIQASKAGVPILLSFLGMAEVLGWEPRTPVVANCDRKRVLSTWAPFCGNLAPAEFNVEFSRVRHLTPQQFVEKLAKELGVSGVVAGENYRFGYKAAGDASELVRLCEEYGMEAYIVSSVMDKNQCSRSIGSDNLKEKGQVSSTRVRYALAKGDMKYVSELLGRQHRLMMSITDNKGFNRSKSRMSVPKSFLLNLSPKEGLYENCSLLVGDEIIVPCRAFIDKTHIHLESDEANDLMEVPCQDCQPIEYFSRWRSHNHVYK